MQNEEKRQFQRIDLHAAMRYQIRGTPDFDNAISDNVSEGGLAFNSLRFIPPSTPIMLELSLLSRILHPICRVSWCQPLPHSDRNRLGLEFVEFDSSERKHLSDFIALQTV